MSNDRINILGVGVNDLDLDAATERIVAAAAENRKGYVCVTGAHGVIESRRDPELRSIHNHSMLTVADGMPNVWLGKLQGYRDVGRVYGPDLMLSVCAASRGDAGCGVRDAGNEDKSSKSLESESRSWAAGHGEQVADRKGFTHFLYGATEEKLAKLKTNLEQWYPGIHIVGTYAPPFRPLNEEEESELQSIVADCRPDFFWVGLSTPKQERFMAEHAAELRVQRRSPSEPREAETGRGMLDAGCGMRGVKVVENTSKPLPTDYRPRTTDHGLQPAYPLDAGILIGVGAAFDIHSGSVNDAASLVKRMGLQWLYRISKEPGRLWKRYLWIVPNYLWLAFLQLTGIRVEED